MWSSPFTNSGQSGLPLWARLRVPTRVGSSHNHCSFTVCASLLLRCPNILIKYRFFWLSPAYLDDYCASISSCLSCLDSYYINNYNCGWCTANGTCGSSTLGSCSSGFLTSQDTCPGSRVSLSFHVCFLVLCFCS